MKKKLFAFMMAALMVLGDVTPALSVQAAEMQETIDVSMGELQVSADAQSETLLEVSSNQSIVAVYVDDGKGAAAELVNTTKTDEEGGWSLDGETGTLTLSGFAGKSIYAMGDLNIVLEGTNTITVPADLGYGIKVDGALTIDDTTSPAADSLTVSVTDATVSTTLLETGSYGEVEAVRINGGTVSLEGTSGEASLYGIERWAYFYNDAVVSVDLYDEGNKKYMVGMGSAVYTYTSGTVSVSIDSTHSSSYGVYSLYTGDGSGNIALTAKGAAHNIQNTFSLDDDMTGNVTVKGYLPYVNASKAKWTVQNQDSFLWSYYTTSEGGFSARYVCDSTGVPLKDFVLVKSESNLPFKFMDSALFDMPEGKVGDEYKQQPYWVEGCVGGAGYYTFALAEDSAPLPEGLSINASSGYISGEPTKPHDAGVAKIKVTSGTESTTFEVNYGKIEDRDYFVTIDGTPYDMEEDTSGTGWVYAASNHTLTLKEYAGGPIYAEKYLNIVLDGANTITVPADLGYGIKVDAALTIDDTTSPAADSLAVTVTDATVSTTLLETGSYGSEEAVTINGGTVNLKGTSEEASLYGIGRWAYFYNDAVVSVDLSDEGNKEYMVGMDSAVYTYTSGTVSVSIDSTFSSSYGVYSLYTGEDSGNIVLTAKGAAHNIQNTFYLDDNMTGNVTVKGCLPYVSASKAKWTVQGHDSFLWSYYTTSEGGFSARYVCDSTGVPLKDFVLVKSESNLPFKFMDSALFDMPEGKVGDEYKQQPYWVEGCVGGTGAYSFALASDSAPLPAGLSVDSIYGYIKGTPTKLHDAGVAKIKVTSGTESATFEVNYGAITWNVLVESMSLDKEEIILNQEDSADLVATILPVNADNCDVIWTVDWQYLRETDKTAAGSNQRAVTLTALNKTGKTKVTATTEIGNLQDSCDVYIKEEKPEAYVTPGGGYIGGLKEGATYLINGTSYTPEAMVGFSGYGVAMDADWAGTTLTIVHANAEEKCNSDAQSLIVPTALIPESLTVKLAGPVMDEAPATRSQVDIWDTVNDYAVTDVLVACESLNWSPYVADCFEGGTVYTATMTLRALGSMTFPAGVEVLADSGDTEITSSSYEVSADEKTITVTVVYAKTTPDGLWMEEIPAQRYTGKALKPEVNVYYRDELLTGKDYTISYKNNTNAAASDAVNAKGKSIAPTVTIKGKGNFTGSVTKTFTISPINLDDYETDEELQKILSISPVYVKNSGKEIKGVPVIKLNGKALAVKSKEYTLEYQDTTPGAYQENGTYAITVVGAGKNFVGSTTVNQTISGKLINKVKITLDKSSYPYDAVTGETYPATITVKDGKTLLEKDVHYTVSYKNYDKIGTATVVITGMGEYSGVATKTYKITGINLTAKMVKQLKNFVYDDTEHSVVSGVNYTITDRETALAEGTDYKISYAGDRTNAGKFMVTFTGINQYTGSVTKTYTISKVQADTLEIYLDDADAVPYAKDGATPRPRVYFGSILLQEGVDYKVSYSNNKKLATSSDKKAPSLYITGMGNFTGNTKKNPVKFTIVGADITSQTCIAAEDVLYKNKKNNYVPKITLVDQLTGKKLAPKTDYKVVRYEIWDEAAGDYKLFEGDKVDAPADRIKMSVTVEGVSNYSGSLTSHYEIYLTSISTVKVDKIPSMEYTGKEITPVPVVTVKTKVGNKTQYVALDPAYYEVAYSNNVEKGTATVYIYGKGQYGGVKKVTFNITSQKMSWWQSLFL